MGYVDMRDRREERGRAVVGTLGPERKDRDVNGPLVAAALALGIPMTILLGLSGLIIILCLCAIGIAFLVQEHVRSRPSNPKKGRGLGSEKQLLLALRESGGLTAVEAALETSLTVDEADGILSHLAERGHLRVEGRDGVLCYSLPGGRLGSGFGPLG